MCNEEMEVGNHGSERWLRLSSFCTFGLIEKSGVSDIENKRYHRELGSRSENDLMGPKKIRRDWRG